MSRIAKLLVAANLLGASVACFDGLNLSLLGSPTQVTSADAVKATPTPTPTPSATPTPSPTPCDPAKLPVPALGICHVDQNKVEPDEIVLAEKAEATLSLTPYQSRIDCSGRIVSVQVDDGCNAPKANQIQWLSSSPSVEIIKGGFGATIVRKGTGVATVTATFEGVRSNPVTVK